MVNKTKLSKKTFSELSSSGELQSGNLLLQQSEGGDGSYSNPYSEAEYNALVAAGYFTGGYVELDGEVFWCLAPAYCDGDSAPDSNWVNILLSYSSATFDVVGDVAQQSPWTVRFTNNAGRVDFRCYTNGWSGNQYVNNCQPFGAGKVMRVSGIGQMLGMIGNLFGLGVVALDFSNLKNAQSESEKWSAVIDITADTIFLISGTYGVLFSLLYTAGLGDQIKSLVLDCME